MLPSADMISQAFAATEAQTYSMQAPELFFSMFSPPPADKDYRIARDRLEEHIVYVARVVRH